MELGQEGNLVLEEQMPVEVSTDDLNDDYDDHAYTANAAAASLPGSGREIEVINSVSDINGSLSLKEPQLVKKSNSTSKIWDYFGFKADKNGYAIDNGKPMCRRCYKEVGCKFGNTSNLFKHLRDNHPSEYGKVKVRPCCCCQFY